MSRQFHHVGNHALQGNASMYQRLTPSYHVPIKFNPLMGIVLVMLFMSFFILGWLGVYLRRCISRELRNRRSAAVPPPPLSAAAQAPPPQQGLQLDTILALPTATFRAEHKKLGPHECSVCLSEFQEKDLVKLLPACGHSFHAACIDEWLFSNSTCPLCRSSLAHLDPYCKTCALHLNSLQQEESFTRDGEVGITIFEAEDQAETEDERLLNMVSEPGSLYRSLSTPTVLLPDDNTCDTCKGREAAAGSLGRALSCVAYVYQRSCDIS